MSTLLAVVSDDPVPALQPLAAAANLSVEPVDGLPDSPTVAESARTYVPLPELTP